MALAYWFKKIVKLLVSSYWLSGRRRVEAEESKLPFQQKRSLVFPLHRSRFGKAIGHVWQGRGLNAFCKPILN